MIPYRQRPAYAAAMTTARRAAGVTQAAMVVRGVASGTGAVSSWETGRRVPTRREWVLYWLTLGADVPGYMEVRGE